MNVRDELGRLVALSGGRLGGLVRHVCATTLSLPPLPSEISVTEPASDAEAVVAAFAEQFSIDVSAINAEQRASLAAALGDKVFPAVVQMYLADFLPRVQAGLAALDVPVAWPQTSKNVAWDQASDPSAVLFARFGPAVARLHALDPVTTEVVRLRGAAQHNCRLCKSLREGHALDAGGSETLYDDIAGFETSTLLTGAHKAALRYVDALIWSPAHIDTDVATGLRQHFSDSAVTELTLDVMRNAMNKIAVALGTDAARVEHGTERYLVEADGRTVFS